jgi:hypothetical protein
MLYGSVTAPASEAQQADQPEPSTAEEFEAVLIAELKAAGFEGSIATDGYEDAEASVFVDGGEVFIHTYADGDTVRRCRAALGGATLLAGTRVETGTRDVEGYPPIWRFVCGTKAYEVVGDGLLPSTPSNGSSSRSWPRNPVVSPTRRSRRPVRSSSTATPTPPSASMSMIRLRRP